VPSCPSCAASPVRGRFCRRCGTELSASNNGDATNAAVPTGFDERVKVAPGQGVRTQSRSSNADHHARESAPHRGATAMHRDAGAGASRPAYGATATQGQDRHIPPEVPAYPPPVQPTAQPPQQPRNEDSPVLVVGLVLAVLLVALAIAVSVILLVANDGTSRTTLLPQRPVGSTTAERQ
jgi:hypothetical protein